MNVLIIVSTRSNYPKSKIFIRRMEMDNRYNKNKYRYIFVGQDFDETMKEDLSNELNLKVGSSDKENTSKVIGIMAKLNKYVATHFYKKGEGTAWQEIFLETSNKSIQGWDGNVSKRIAKLFEKIT
ncbi:hypothetical protein [Shouchella miscanthi]|uniref:Uncharacterized protein n=1 Tax=Shouchella miscanthi TaxID=2598861 RepID=A0ABU6NSV3_9BACI|nr:hypothetical protein [Shouchella miscanthi]